ncbi:hypothetical protein LTR10_002684 [Elasticomyces elasticus]|nr:hypothetical protein LTR10_002684 [Elasticomyces elasticus]KAK4967974.1 hypothetical protein LTR42_010302 [Elasticomyces elasticus]
MARCRLLELPLELRNRIFELAVKETSPLHASLVRHRSVDISDRSIVRYSKALPQQPALARTNRLIRQEVLPVFYHNSIFLIQHDKLRDYSEVMFWWRRFANQELRAKITKIHYTFQYRQASSYMSVSQDLQLNSVEVCLAEAGKLEYTFRGAAEKICVCNYRDRLQKVTATKDWNGSDDDDRKHGIGRALVVLAAQIVPELIEILQTRRAELCNVSRCLNYATKLVAVDSRPLQLNHERRYPSSKRTVQTNVLPHQPPLARTNRQLRSEVLPIFYGQNIFHLKHSFSDWNRAKFQRWWARFGNPLAAKHMNHILFTFHADDMTLPPTEIEVQVNSTGQRVHRIKCEVEGVCVCEVGRCLQALPAERILAALAGRIVHEMSPVFHYLKMPGQLELELEQCTECGNARYAMDLDELWEQELSGTYGGAREA